MSRTDIRSVSDTRAVSSTPARSTTRLVYGTDTRSVYCVSLPAVAASVLHCPGGTSCEGRYSWERQCPLHGTTARQIAAGNRRLLAAAQRGRGTQRLAARCEFVRPPVYSLLGTVYVVCSAGMRPPPARCHRCRLVGTKGTDPGDDSSGDSPLTANEGRPPSPPPPRSPGFDIYRTTLSSGPSVV